MCLCVGGRGREEGCVCDEGEGVAVRVHKCQEVLGGEGGGPNP